MHILGIIRVFRTAQFRVIVDALPDDDLDLSWDEDGNVARDIDDGDVIAFCARVRVMHDEYGELASDYLGGCIYTSLRAFMDHRECGAENKRLAAIGAKARCGSYFADMVKGTCEAARDRLSKLQTLKVYIRQ